jgi:hypothetical protein
LFNPKGKDKSMAGRIRERDLIIPALRAAAARPNGYISTSDLIQALEDEFQPEGTDAEILDGRQDSYFSQKVRNLKSHKKSSTSMFARGYAIEEDAGFRITEAGRAFLTQVPEAEE